MSKSGNNFYYIQDELGSPMYMTGTDGAVVSSYAFDDFGRNIDPFTGNIRNNNSKHAYTKQGNIIQPFAFTGYQEDEVSGLKFAQARFYSTDNGRFVGKDQNKGFIDNADTQHSYMYCLNNPINLIDENGNEPSIPNPASTVNDRPDVGFYPAPKSNPLPTGGDQSDVGFYPVPQTNPASNVESSQQCEDGNSSISITSQDVSTASKVVQNGIDFLKMGLLTGAKALSHNSKKITTLVNSARIARPGHALRSDMSNNAYRNLLRSRAAKSAANAEKATNIAKKIDKFGTAINVAAVALDVGIGIYDNIKNKQPVDRIVSDAVVDATISTLQIVAATALTAAIVSSGFGLLAVGVGWTIGAIVSKATDDWKVYKGKSIRDLAKDAMYYEVKHHQPALL